MDENELRQTENRLTTTALAFETTIKFFFSQEKILKK